MTIDSDTSFHLMYIPTALTRRPANRASPLTHACHSVQRSSKTPLSQTIVANCIPNRDGNQTELEVMRRLIELELCSIWSHSEKHLQTPKSTENLLAGVVSCSPQSCSPRTLLQQLHWLPIKHRIDFKIANITFRTLHFSQPAYRRSSFHPCHSTRSLRLSNTNLLSAPFVRTSFDSCSFSVAPPKIWNSLPPSLRTCTSPDIFRRHLKTHYCQQAFQFT